MRIERRYTVKGISPYAKIEFRTAKIEICNSDGSVVFHLEECELPSAWSQVAAKIIAKKYFRKTGVPYLLSARRGGWRAIVAVSLRCRRAAPGRIARIGAHAGGARRAPGI
jgi:hypothetical protein